MHWATFLLSFASQILSNEEKRANFDRYGDAGESQGYSQHQQRQFHHFHEGFYFDESFFHFPFNSERRDTSDEKYLLHFSHYINEIVPDSFKKPYLIKITSDWCFSCIHIEPVWKEVAQELEALGKDEALGLGTNVLAEPGLGRVSTSSWSIEGLRDLGHKPNTFLCVSNNQINEAKRYKQGNVKLSF